MSQLGRVCLLAMIPVNLLLILWVWFGRVAFGVGGWFLLIYLVTVVPALLLGLLASTVLAYTQRERPRRLDRGQAWAQVAVWLGMFGFGLFSPDFGDTSDSEVSLLTQIFGRSDALLDLSYQLTIGAAVLTVIAWLVLMSRLVFARQRGSTETSERAYAG